MTVAFDRNPETDGLAPDRVPAILRHRRGHMWLSLAVILAIGLVTGLGSAYLAVDNAPAFDTLELGVWQARPLQGTTEADPYSAATHARTGRVPLASGEGLIFLARSDSAGATLSPACDYLLEGQAAPARLWTLTALDAGLRLSDTGAERSGLHSRQVLRRPDGSFAVHVAARARAGNWLPSARDADGLVLALRLYDTPLTTGTGVANVPMPEITRGDCR
ncbi:DUF1214 domain-containing protein [Stappia stellulata]|uniref:DUF1214 domain-containing protein n=1 Tax=Stappia stellulata TaxID=71235 RepID=UPI0004224898|nr:DUF1214 domain-containing protein [Stappia stellulata]